jgi:uncharacterized protein (TIGR02246 family)
MNFLPVPLLLALLLAAPAVTPPAHAQAPSEAEAAVMEVVNRLFDGMRARSGEMVASVFHPQARMVTTGTEPDGSPRVQVQDIEAFVTAVGQGGVPWNEPLFATDVRVDGNLAHVWTFYRFYAAERFSHCGYNSIELVRADDVWRIISLTDTRRTDRCEPPDSKPSAR